MPSFVSLRLDAQEHKEGSHSLLISSDQPVDFSISQDAFLRTGTLWEASAWIKTDASAPGPELRIESPAGDQGAEKAQLGVTGWQQVSVLFRAVSPERTTLRVVAFAQSSGKVWFDDVRLTPVPEPDAIQDITISSEKLTTRPIDLKQGGQFIEPLCRLTPSMIAQQVDSTSFEEEPAWKPSYKRAIDKPYRPWYPDGAVHLAKYSLDSDNPFNGKVSQKIELAIGPSRAGISQDGFYIDTGHSYRLRLHMRSNRPVNVQASLHADGGALAEPVALGTASSDWQSATATLRATKSSRNATLTIDFEGPGTLWLDRIYLIDEQAVLGIWRPDVVNALKAMNPGVIRFGGSTLEVFEWDKCIGDWDHRMPYVTNPWGGLEPNFVGVEEFVKLCRYVNAEPLVCVRWTGKTPADAEAEVEYFNGSADSKWGQVRAKNGHPQPYGVKYWQIGNEIGGAKYDSSVRAFAEAMRKADPNIKVLSSFPSADTLRLGGDYLDYLCPHHYEAANLVAEENSLRNLQDEIAQNAHGKDVRVAVTEWNTTAGDMGLTRGMLLTLGNALSCSRYQNLLHRYSGLVEIAIRSNLSDSFGSGVLQPGPGWLYLSPTYYSQSLYQRAAGSFPLRVTRSGSLAPHLQDPDISAVLSPDGKTLRIYAVNSTAKPERIKLSLQNLGSVRTGSNIFILQDRDRRIDSEAMNSHDEPGRVAVRSEPLSATGPQFEYSFEPYTVTLLELALE